MIVKDYRTPNGAGCRRQANAWVAAVATFSSLIAMLLSGPVIHAHDDLVADPIDSIGEPEEQGVDADAFSDDQIMGIFDLPIESLADLEITIVSKRSQRQFATPAASYVLRGDDIRRIGSRNIADALRYVPGVQVAAIDGHRYAISIRGFNDEFANKLQVMIDGRELYTPLFAGVLWDVQDTMMEDIEKIEVIRGPGASVWGSNAVNGVINVVTKSAKDTQGGLFTATTGSLETFHGAVRYGGELEDGGFFRVYGKGFTRRETPLTAGGRGDDDWQQGRVGSRFDWESAEGDQLTFDFDLYAGDHGFLVGNLVDRNRIFGGHFLAKWSKELPDGSQMQLQSYYDRNDRFNESLDEKRNAFDIDFFHLLPMAEGHELHWGLGYRLYHDEVDPSSTVAFVPESETFHLFSAFIQDEIELIPDTWTFTVGTKFEHHDYSGFNVQPTFRTAWLIDDQSTLWGAVSRAVRTPSRADNNLFAAVPAGPVTVVSLPNDRLGGEVIWAYEAGYRLSPVEELAFDLTLFFNEYSHLRSRESRTAFPIITSTRSDGLSGESYGGEFATTWRVSESWVMHAGYSYLQMQLHTRSGSMDTTSESAEGTSPHHQAFMRSSWNLSKSWQFDLGIRYVDELPSLQIPAYTAMDLRLAHRPNEQVEFIVGAQNLLDNQHPEFLPGFNGAPQEVEHSVYVKMNVRF